MVLKNKNQKDTEDKEDNRVMKNEKAFLKKMMYKELDESESFIKLKPKPNKINKPKQKDTKPVRGKSNFLELE